MGPIDQIRELEEQLLSRDVRGSEASLLEILCPDFLEIGASGKVWNRDQVIRSLSEATPATRQMEKFQARFLSTEIVLVTYELRRFEGDGSVAARSLRSSIWVQRREGWQMIFHQGTPQPT